MTSPIKPLLILGSGEFAVDVADCVQDIGGWRVEGFVQNVERQQDAELEGLPVYWIGEAFRQHPGAWAVCALGSQHRSRIIAQAASEGAKFATLVHPFTRVSRQAQVGEGSIIAPGSVISAKTRIGRHVIVNRGATIGHHVEIGDYAFIAPGVSICGSCVIGPGAFIGVGGIISDHLTVGAEAFVSAGAVVTKDVAEKSRVLGIPALPVATNEDVNA